MLPHYIDNLIEYNEKCSNKITYAGPPEIKRKGYIIIMEKNLCIVVLIVMKNIGNVIYMDYLTINLNIRQGNIFIGLYETFNHIITSINTISKC